VNSRKSVIEKGIYPASAYNDSEIDSTLTLVPMMQITYEDASSLLK
jgi:hypothetical protein